MFYLEAVLLGLGLAMDAAAVSMANGLNEPAMRTRKMLCIGGAFGVFQGIMPLIGYAAGTLFASYLSAVVPYLAFVILGFLGIKMIVEGAKRKPEEPPKALTPRVLLLQAVATSIDALTVGIVYISTPFLQALICFAVIAVVTFGVSCLALVVGKKFGTIFSGHAEIVGGVILVAIGLKILIEHLVAIF